MRKFNDAVVSWYLQWTMLLTCVIVMLAEGQDWSVFRQFDVWAWVISFLTGATSVYSETLRFKSLKLTKASGLQKIQPISILFQWIFDVALFHVHYTKFQDGSLAFLFLLYSIQGLKYVFFDAKQKTKRLEERDLKKSILSQQR